jgi:hypothetical protein
LGAACPYKKSDLLLASSQPIYMKKCAKGAGSLWPHIVYSRGQRTKFPFLVFIVNITFSKYITFLRDDPKNFKQVSGAYLRSKAFTNMLF